MKKFHFRLERILEYRKLIKDEKTKELLISRNKLYADQEHLKELETAALLNTIGDDKFLTVERLNLINDYAERLKIDIEHQKEVIEESKKAVLKAQEAYIEAAKDEGSLQTLKERRRAEYMNYLEKEDFKNNDEVVIQKIGHERLLSK